MERRLGGRYELREQLGDSTWVASDIELGRDVVVRFGEVAGATLQHPAISRVFDQGEEDGERYAVLEYLPGGTLAERGALTEESAAGLAAALAYAHEQGVVHGALGPEAVLFDAEGRAKLTRFQGVGNPETDRAALAELRTEYAATEVRAPVEAATAVVPPPSPPARPERGRWGLLAAALAALVLVAAGIAAAFLAGGDDDGGAGVTVTTDPITSVTIPTATTEEEPAPPPTGTTDETTTTTTAPTTEPATTETEPPTTPTTVPPPQTTEPVPSLPPTDPSELPTLPVTTVQEPPPTETAPQAA